MTRRTDNRTTRSLVPASEIPDFTPVPIKPRSDGWESLFPLQSPARTSVRLATRNKARRPAGLAVRWSLTDERQIEANGLASATARPERFARRKAKGADAPAGT